MTSQPSLHDFDDRTALVTGASSGVGLEIARALAAAGARVIMPVRSRARGDAAIARIRETVPDAAVELRDLDLTRLESVAAVAEELIAEEDPIDLLVLNAGIVLLGDPVRHVTPDGFEAHFQTNFLGHYALTRALLPLLRSSRTRVAVQCSLAAARGHVPWRDLQSTERYAPLRAYASSKMLLGLFAVELARRSAADHWGLAVNLCHPGVVPDTGIAPAIREKQGTGAGARLAARLGHSPASAARTALAALRAEYGTAEIVGPRMFAPAGAFGMSGPPREQRPFHTLTDRSDGARAWGTGEALAVGAVV
ncbi:NAD(P)-dependent dehydrogenase (short-subunit alcohol dehydrogenase family) [Microbacterium terrae]|uniref:3-oxoacyl-[acyl-carrier-protein] reductase FabG n=1 Tax=Microbacterium terrae TaxID=69369 RepID=A0A0M2H133_9MICO|nr:SDR family NAD(P)-dependent oxidoreductase [Microbacterium terrae]KJL37725.1 3-oxoacyl-[acyl-carrier-protein] reductase FabG [Microbacterium terrae]MBP1076557.1 NAD(P)-dependent dehydrogenase (short-subunit alcohol dehydrogenase family) [Microbacterium terrae]GLJ97386.1 short chain dehydrogenase [Microbacterium terrae]